MIKVNKSLKTFIKRLLPPVVLDSLPKNKIKWSGNYSSWKDAQAECSGYDQGSIIEKVDAATQQVVSGQFPYERDSVLFDEIQYSWPLLSGLLWSHSVQGSLDVLDFGGSLGATYYQNIKFLNTIPHAWNIIEQEQFVSIGKNKYQSKTLHFYKTVEECLMENAVNTLLISSTLQYLPDPMQTIKELINRAFPVIILDRLWVTRGNTNRLTKQEVPKKIYQASYPCWLFSESSVLALFKAQYELIESFESSLQNEPFSDSGSACLDKGYIFRLK